MPLLPIGSTGSFRVVGFGAGQFAFTVAITATVQERAGRAARCSADALFAYRPATWMRCIGKNTKPVGSAAQNVTF